MELKDIVLSTLAELDNIEEKENKTQKQTKEPKLAFQNSNEAKQNDQSSENSDEKIFLNNVQERLLVLFEGLQNPKNDNLDIKLDITLNFLEYLLANIESRLENIK